MGVFRSALLVGAAGLLVVCAAGYRQASSDTSRAPTEAVSQREPAGDLRALDEREVTPELRAEAVDVLEQHSGEPLGTEVPIESGGRRYVARLEQHWDAQRGPHRGVTLYTSHTK